MGGDRLGSRRRWKAVWITEKHEMLGRLFVVAWEARGRVDGVTFSLEQASDSLITIESVAMQRLSELCFAGFKEVVEKHLPGCTAIYGGGSVEADYPPGRQGEAITLRWLLAHIFVVVCPSLNARFMLLGELSLSYSRDAGSAKAKYEVVELRPIKYMV